MIDQIGIFCGNKPCEIADRKVKSLLYLNLGMEGRKMQSRKISNTNVETKTLNDIWEEL